MNDTPKPGWQLPASRPHMKLTNVPPAGYGGAEGIPSSIGPFRVIKRLGYGGMAEVFLCSDDNGNTFAVKLLPSHLQANTSLRKRFIHETSALAMLNHPNICRIHTVEVLGDRPYFVMEHVEGIALSHMIRFISHSSAGTRAASAADTKSAFETIFDRIDQLKTRHGSLDDVEVASQERMALPLQQARAITGKLCDAVQYAHERGILHRDIKPANVVVRRDGEPVLLDFGLAKWRHGEGEESLTGSGDLLGTIDYMAPEQALSTKNVAERADVYGLGVILYELATGRRFFTLTGNAIQDIKRLGEHRPERPRACNPNIDAGLEQIILKATRADREVRYHSCRQFGADLRRYQDGLAVVAKPPALAYRIARFVKKQRMPVMLAAMITALLAGFGAYFGWDYYRRWGRWVPVVQEDFTDGQYDTTRFAIEPIPGYLHKPWPLDSAGLHTTGFEWCWLRNVSVTGDVRLDLTFS